MPAATTITTPGALGKSSLRAANDRAVLLAILRQPGISRLAIAHATGLSPSAITGITDRLMEQGFLREGKRPESSAPTAGRPRAPLYVHAEARLAIGVAIEAHGATVALAGLTGEILVRQTIEASPDFLPRIHAAIADLAHQAGHKALGVAISIPGNLDPATGRVRHATNLHWHDLDILGTLPHSLGLPIACENNSDLAALAERWFRHDASLDNFVFVTLRVGLGTGLILNGQLVKGARHCAGEFGHTRLVPGGRPCVCGQLGCWEEYASDRALIRRYGQPEVDSLAIVERARQGDPAALRALEETATSLAEGLCPLILGLNPAAIAVDDWAAAGWDLVHLRVWQTIRARVPEAWRQGIEIFPSTHAGDASLRGALALVLSRFFTSLDPLTVTSAAPVTPRGEPGSRG